MSGACSDFRTVCLRVCLNRVCVSVWLYGPCNFQHTDGSVATEERSDARKPTLVASLQDHHIVQVSAGAEHSVVLTEEGEVLAFGAGDAGQLGRRTADYQCEADAFRPVRMMGTARLRIVQVKAPHFAIGVMMEVMMVGGCRGGTR